MERHFRYMHMHTVYKNTPYVDHNISQKVQTTNMYIHLKFLTSSTKSPYLVRSITYNKIQQAIQTTPLQNWVEQEFN